MKKLARLCRNKRVTALAITMLVLITIFLFLFNFIHVYSTDNSNDINNKQLLLVHVIFRHGIRTPADTYPNDPYLNYTFDPDGWGALTTKGKQEMFHAGLFLRERYNNFLSDIYYPKEYYVQTTDSDRTKMTAQLINAAIWPPKGYQKWNSKLEWQPIPAAYEPLNQDSLLLVRKPCPRYYEELQRVEKEEDIPKRLFQENSELFKILTNITGLEIINFDDAQSLYSTLKAEEVYGLPLPEWTKNYYPEKLQSLTEFSFILNSYTDLLKRLKGGVLLKKIMVDYYIKSGHSIRKRFADFYEYIHKRNVRQVLNDDEALKLLSEWTKETTNIIPPQRKMVLYAGHDSTVANLLAALKVWESQVPDYGIMTMFEFSKDLNTGQYGLEVYLRNNTQVEPYLLTIPKCESFCPLNKLVELVESVIPRNWENECKAIDPTFTPPTQGGP